MQYSRAGSQSRALIHVVTDRQEREFTIEDLEEWTEYEVRVQALNGIGMGPWSQPVRGRTRESGELLFPPEHQTGPPERPSGRARSNEHPTRSHLPNSCSDLAESAGLFSESEQIKNTCAHVFSGMTSGRRRRVLCSSAGLQGVLGNRRFGGNA